MSTTTGPPTTSQPPPAPSTGPDTLVGTQPPPSGSDTPRRLRRLSLILVVAGVVIALVGALALVALLSTLDRAQGDTEQLIRVQRIETDLLVADANATNTFLVGGLESPQRRQAYQNALAEVGSLVADAARAQPADAAALSALNTQVLDYSTAIEAARANNRQGFPVGAQYLRQASAGLRSDTLGVAEALIQANAGRARAAMSTAWGWPLIVLTLLGLAVFVIAQVLVARQFKRRINPGLLAGSIVLFASLLASTVALIALTGSVRLIRDGSFDDLTTVAGARVEANLAKSSESLTLINRGSGQAYEQGWQRSAAAVESKLSMMRDHANVLADWRRYAQVHDRIRTLDDGGRWDAAVDLATGSGAGSANGRFAPVDLALASIIDGSGTATVDSLGRHRNGLVVGLVLVVGAGLAAAWLGRRGIAARLREYR